MKERIWINRVISKIMKQPFESDTDARDRVITFQVESSLHVNPTSEMSHSTSSRLHVRMSKNVSYRLKVNEFADF